MKNDQNLLSSAEYNRYSRHMTLPEVGAEGQKKLKKAKVLVVGAGGLGSPIILYLAAAGIGTIGIIDFDLVDETNLQRQVLYNMANIGTLKTESAKEKILQLNPHIKVNTYNEGLTADNALSIISEYDVVLDGTDNFSSRYLVNDACVLLGKPNVYGSIYRFDGQISVFNHEGGPCYRCLYPSPPPPNLIPSCAEGGVLGILPGIIGTLQVNEALKIILGIGQSLKGRFILFDALKMEFNEMKAQKNPQCSICGEKPTIKSLMTETQYSCVTLDSKKEASHQKISVFNLKERMDRRESPLIIDVRESFELEIVRLEGSKHIPLKELNNQILNYDSNKEIILLCKSGIRSSIACEELKKNNFKNVKSVDGGILAWAKEVDTSLMTY
tara:strand:- start:3012 stop:4166 length:1155 start_codon:yes stop_codon:yes gene_type:complete